MTYFLRLLLLLLACPGAWACAICAPADGQNSLLLRLLAADTVALAAPDSDGAGYKPKALIKGSLIAYALPLVSALGAGGLVQSAYDSDPATMLGMAAGLALGLLAARVCASRLSAQGALAPRILRRAKPGETCGTV